MGDAGDSGAGEQQVGALDLAEVARAFGLPGGLTVAARHRGAVGAWQIRDAQNGEYSLKRTAAAAADFVLAELRNAAILETAALAATLEIAEPVVPRQPAIGLAAEVGGWLVWMHRWVDGSPVGDGPPAAGGDPGLLRWVGQLLAGLHRLPVTPTRDAAATDLASVYGIHPAEHWREWLEQAAGQKAEWVPAVTRALPAIEAASDLVAAALSDTTLPRVLSHRDVTPWNVLATADGFRLCDFGYSGTDVAWYEVCASAVGFGRQPAAVLDAYLAAGGKPGPRTTAALARTVGFTLNSLAFQLWLAIGHRDVPEERRREAARLIPGVLARFLGQLDELDRTSHQLFGT